MNHHRDEEEFYASLKEKLTNSTLWPSEYLYKFIIPNVEERIQQLQKVFDNKGAAITTKKSSSGNYISFSVNLRLNNPDEVIKIYKEVSTIEGIVSL